MADTIQIDPPPNQSTISGTIVPEKDGVFLITAKAHAQGNNQGTPTIWAEIFINGRSDKKSDRIAWQNGPGSITLSTAEALVGGKDYTIAAISGNQNASATGIEMSARRVSGEGGSDQ